MFKRLHRFRTNENILIAVDMLLHSKTAFMNIFLMAFMMRISLSESPMDFLIYCLIKYFSMGIFSLLLMNTMRKHVLASWRFSMVFSVLQIVIIIMMGGKSPWFTYALAPLTGLESVLYWRPKIYFDVAEVAEERRVRYITFGQILNEVGKIVMPIILGVLISDKGYQGAAVVILAIAAMELMLSILFRPTRSVQIKRGHNANQIWKYVLKHKSLRKLLLIQLMRGIVSTSAAYVVISQIHIYRALGSDVSLGIFTSVAAGISVVFLYIYRKLATSRRRRVFVMAITLPAVILVPLLAILMPGDSLIAIVLYLVAQSLLESYWSITVAFSRLQSILKQHVHDNAFHIEIECVSEVFLTFGRIISLGLLFLIFLIGQDQYMLQYLLFTSFAIIPLAILSLPSKQKPKNMV